MEKTEKLLMGIENLLSVANELVDEISRLKEVEEECIILKEKLFLSQFTRCERQVFELAIDGLSTSQMQKRLFKEESTITHQRKSIVRKLGVGSMKEAVQKFHDIQQKSDSETITKLVRIS